MSKDNKALQDLISYQNLLGELGYTIMGDGTYYKDYGLLDGSVARIVPLFDKGISLDASYRLTAISVASQAVIPILEGGNIPLDKIPRECMSDVTRMIAVMAPQSRMPLTETYVLTSQCTSCGEIVSSFFKNEDGCLCLACL